jgi:arylsulfatase A-like enzyme
VPIIFVRGGQEGREALATICEASVVDVTPTILDILGLLPSFHATLQNRPDEMKGHSLIHAIDRILTKDHPTGSENICGSYITVPLP